jgi:putative transposase
VVEFDNMPRIARIVFDNALLHIFNRGNAKQIVFHDDEDFEHFLYILAYFKEKYGFKMYHLCPMPNHFHFEWEIPQAKILSPAMHDITQTYTRYHHQKYQTVGYLWQGRFKNLIVEKGDYQLLLGGYIERNPVRAGLVERPEDWRWSSYRFYAFGEPMRLWIKVNGMKKCVDLIDEDPIYRNFSNDPAERQKLYRQFISAMNDEVVRQELGLVERRRGRPRKG